MKLQQIRNATVKLQYDNQILLVDPMLSNKGTLPSIAQKSINWTIFVQLIRRHLRYDWDYKN